MNLALGLGLNRHGDLTVWGNKGMKLKEMHMETEREKTTGQDNKHTHGDRTQTDQTDMGHDWGGRR